VDASAAPFSPTVSRRSSGGLSGPGWEPARAFVVRVFGGVGPGETAERLWDFKSVCSCIARPNTSPYRVLPSYARPGRTIERNRGRGRTPWSPAGRGTGRSKKEAEQDAAREACATRARFPAESGVADAPVVRCDDSLIAVTAAVAQEGMLT